jgi:hypothetical protein
MRVSRRSTRGHSGASAAALAAALAMAACTDAPPAGLADAGFAPLPEVRLDPAEPRLRRLTAVQYKNAVADLFGPGLVVPPLEPDFVIGGFASVGAAETAVSPWGVEQYEQAALSLAEQALADATRRARWVPCQPAAPLDEACARSTLAPLARRAFRREVEDEELDALVAVAREAAGTLASFDAGLRFAVATILQSPSFLYRDELGETDPARPGERLIRGAEMASRLSFLFWNSGPDEALLDAAARGELDDEAGIRAAAARLLSSPRAVEGMRNFFVERFKLYRLDRLSKDPKVFSHASPELGPSAKEETLRVLDHLVFDADADYRTLLTLEETFVDRRLAALYGLAAPDPNGFARVRLSREGGRRGLLGQAAFLNLAAHATSSSPTLRGKFILETLLCRTVLPPPADVSTAIPEPSPEARSLRERLEQHRVDPRCATCHLSMDGIGLTFETFDGVGRRRIKDNGIPVETAGVLDQASFADAWEAADAVAAHPELGPCMVRALYAYGTGRVPTAGEAGQLSDLSERFLRSGYRVKSLLVELAASPGFRRVSEASR